MEKAFPLSLLMLLLNALLLVSLLSCSIIPPKRGGDPGFSPVSPPSLSPLSQSDGAIYQAGYDMTLFEDVKAKRVGDIMTVLLVEKTDAKKSASTATARDTDVTIAEPTLFGGKLTLGGRDILSNSLSSANKFDGSGDSQQSNELDGNITVTVAKVLSNGNLLVQGEKWISINQGKEYIRLQGIVRPIDIRADNTVLSTQVGNILIDYGGTGTLANSNRKGWLAEFFTHVLWPF